MVFQKVAARFVLGATYGLNLRAQMFYNHNEIVLMSSFELFRALFEKLEARKARTQICCSNIFKPA